MSRKNAREFAIANLVSVACAGCGKIHKLKDLEVHHKNQNCFDNSLENLTILCKKCHAKVDTATRLAIKERVVITDCVKYTTSVTSVEVKR